MLIIIPIKRVKLSLLGCQLTAVILYGGCLHTTIADSHSSPIKVHF